MWYFAWILGIGFASAFAVLNAMWLEFDEAEEKHEQTRAERAP